MNTLIQQIVALEWEMFHTTQNVGGPASCQNNRPQFEIMRRSQFLCWTEPLLASYLQDLLGAREQHHNLISYKYAYMMERSAPEEYAAIRDQLPALSAEKLQLVDTLRRQTVLWAEAFALQYPRLARQGRPIHSYQDTPAYVSVETYCTGELKTYSEQTLRLLAQYYAALAEEGRNLHLEVLEQELRLSGLGTLAQTEQQLNRYDTQRE